MTEIDSQGKPDSLLVNHCARLDAGLCRLFQAAASWNISRPFLRTQSREHKGNVLTRHLQNLGLNLRYPSNS